MKDARLRQDPQDGKAVVGDALQQKQCHLLAADDLIWLVERLGTFQSSWSAGQAIAAWLYHHGPVHTALLEVAESIARFDDARWLDDVLLWIEPTPHRWHQHARWRVRPVWEDTAELLAAAGREPPGDLGGSEAVAVFKQQAAGPYAEHARRVVAERGDAARRSLRASPAEAEPGSGVVLILETWAEVLG